MALDRLLFRPLLLLAVAAAGCTFDPRMPEATPEACPGALLEGELLADDADGLIVRHAEGFVTAVIWPDGYVVRVGDPRELLTPSGDTVAREGDHVSLGGGMNAGDTAFVVCGPFRVTPR